MALEDAYHLCNLAGCVLPVRQILNITPFPRTFLASSLSIPRNQPRLVVWVDDFAFFFFGGSESLFVD